jgi:hypothetical protein
VHFIVVVFILGLLYVPYILYGVSLRTPRFGTRKSLATAALILVWFLQCLLPLRHYRTLRPGPVLRGSYIPGLPAEGPPHLLSIGAPALWADRPFLLLARIGLVCSSAVLFCQLKYGSAVFPASLVFVAMPAVPSLLLLAVVPHGRSGD